MTQVLDFDVMRRQAAGTFAQLKSLSARGIKSPELAGQYGQQYGQVTSAIGAAFQQALAEIGRIPGEEELSAAVDSFEVEFDPIRGSRLALKKLSLEDGTRVDEHTEVYTRPFLENLALHPAFTPFASEHGVRRITSPDGEEYEIQAQA